MLIILYFDKSLDKISIDYVHNLSNNTSRSQNKFKPIASNYKIAEPCDWFKELAMSLQVNCRNYNETMLRLYAATVAFCPLFIFHMKYRYYKMRMRNLGTRQLKYYH